MLSYLQCGNMTRHCASAVIALMALTFWSDSSFGQTTLVLDNGQPISLTEQVGQIAVSINASTGNVIARSTTGGIQCTQPQSPVINSFFPTSSTVTPGSAITLNWSSSNATSCTGSQGSGTIWASLGILPASGSRTFNAPATSSSNPITFQLNCSGSSTVSATTQVTAQNENPGSCTAIYPSGNVSAWNGTFGSWPSFSARVRISSVPFNGYQSWSFVATSVAGEFGTVASYEYPNDGDGFGQMSISRTPGCFTASELGANCLGPPNRSSGVSWKNGGGPFQCALTPGQTYYVNFTYGNSTSGPGPHCPGQQGSCGADIVNQPQD